MLKKPRKLPMKLPRDDFKKLQQKWYKTLANLGFKDIEEIKGEELVLKETASFCYRHSPDQFDREMKEEYYRCIAQLVYDEDTEFRNATDRHILMMHAEGMNAKKIIEDLSSLGISKNRNSIRYIIRRYEMLWGMKQYNSKQLNERK